MLEKAVQITTRGIPPITTVHAGRLLYEHFMYIFCDFCIKNLLYFSRNIVAHILLDPDWIVLNLTKVKKHEETGERENVKKKNWQQ